jgi:hypothetical protein
MAKSASVGFSPAICRLMLAIGTDSLQDCGFCILTSEYLKKQTMKVLPQRAQRVYTKNTKDYLCETLCKISVFSVVKTKNCN